MASLQTLRGPIETSEMGLTLAHEHVLFQFDDSRRERTIDFAVKLLREAREAGIRTVVDLTPVRRIDWFMEIAGLVEVNIVACTGYYLERLTPRSLAAFGEDEMVERMVRELTAGIDSTNVRAGIIKVAADQARLTAWEEQVFRAAARVQQKTGACIATHCCRGAREQAETLLRAGADLTRVFFSHVEADWEGRSLKEQARYLAEIARQGGSFSFNRFGLESDNPKYGMARSDLHYLVRYLCDAGYQDNVQISIDHNWAWTEEGRMLFEKEQWLPDARRRTFAFMMTEAVPLLMQEGGFTEKDIHTFLVDNPRRFFERATVG